MQAANRPAVRGSICKHFQSTRSRNLQGASACCANSPFVVFVKALLAIDAVCHSSSDWAAFVLNDGVSGGFPVERAGVQVGRLRGEVAPLYSGCTTPKLRDSGIYKNILLM